MAQVPAEITKELRSLDRKDVANWLRRGELLTQARELLGSDGGFGTYVRRDVGMSLRTAQRAMAAWRHFGHAPTAARLSIEAMTILAPYPEAHAEALALAEKERITRAIAQRLVAPHKPQRGAPAVKIEPGWQTAIPSGELVVIVKGKTQPPREEIVAALLAAARSYPQDEPAPTPGGFFTRPRRAG